MKTFKNLQPDDILYGVSREGKFTQFIIDKIDIQNYFYTFYISNENNKYKFSKWNILDNNIKLLVVHDINNNEQKCQYLLCTDKAYLKEHYINKLKETIKNQKILIEKTQQNIQDIQNKLIKIEKEEW